MSPELFQQFLDVHHGDKTVETVATDRWFAVTQLKLGVNEKLLSIRCYRSLVFRWHSAIRCIRTAGESKNVDEIPDSREGPTASLFL